MIFFAGEEQAKKSYWGLSLKNLENHSALLAEHFLSKPAEIQSQTI